MKRKLIMLSMAGLSLASCQKMVPNIIPTATGKSVGTTPTSKEFVKYTIAKGEQYCDKNNLQVVNYSELSFVVKFDSSAIYNTVNPANQYDINKLYGFSDNNADHHQYSARFGWRWSDNALRLFGYVYNKGVMTFKELGAVAIGSENTCSIKVTAGAYIFTLNGITQTMPRLSTTSKGSGYKLYPYFGGDELAPHTISIWIKE